jgi:hypothetical protein
METTIPSIKELDAKLTDYAVATKERDTPLVKIFLGIVISAFVVVFLGEAVGLSKSNVISVCILLLVGLVALAVFIISTTRKWERQHGVFCPKCERSLVCLGEYLEAIEEGEEETPETMECPKCGAIVATR